MMISCFFLYFFLYFSNFFFLFPFVFIIYKVSLVIRLLKKKKKKTSTQSQGLLPISLCLHEFVDTYLYILVIPAWFCFIGIIHCRLADFDLSIVSNIWFGTASLMLKSNTGCVHVDVIFGIQKQRFFFFFFFFFFFGGHGVVPTTTLHVQEIREIMYCQS